MSGCQRLWPTTRLVGELLRRVEREDDLGHATASVRAGHLWPALSSSIPVRKLGGRGDHVKNTGHGPRALRSPSCSERSSSRSTSSCPSDGGAAVRINAVRGGEGPPVLLLHGFPQSHVMWHRIAPELAREHTVVAADLRGYGDSDRPDGGCRPRRVRVPRHGGRPGRADGGARLRAVRRDRSRPRRPGDAPDGARPPASGWSGWRCSTSCPRPTSTATSTARLATAYYHWFFLIQPRRPAGAADRRRPAGTSCTARWAAGAAGSTRTTPRRCASTSGCSPTPPPATR